MSAIDPGPNELVSRKEQLAALIERERARLKTFEELAEESRLKLKAWEMELRTEPLHMFTVRPRLRWDRDHFWFENEPSSQEWWVADPDLADIS